MATTFPCSGMTSALAVTMQQVVTTMATGEIQDIQQQLASQSGAGIAAVVSMSNDIGDNHF